MGKKRSRYTQEFKKEAVRLVRETGYSQVEAAKNLGINAKNLNRWLHAEEKPADRGRPVKLSAEQEELRQLRKENKRLFLECEILKKAAAFFAKLSG